MSEIEKTNCEPRQPPGPDATFEELVDWYQSEEFSAALTNLFWDAKKKAINERDALLAAQAQQQQ